MEAQRVHEIIQQVMVWVASIGGGAVLVMQITKVVLTILNYFIRKKPMKLSDEDRQIISQNVAEIVTKNMETGMNVDISAQIDNATHNELQAMKQKTDEFITKVNGVTNITKKLGLVIADLHSPSASLKNDLLNAINDAPFDDIIELEPKKEKAKLFVHKKDKAEEVNY